MLIGNHPMLKLSGKIHEEWRNNPPPADDRLYERVNEGFAKLIMGAQQAAPVGFIGAITLGVIGGMTVTSVNKANSGGSKD